MLRLPPGPPGRRRGPRPWRARRDDARAEPPHAGRRRAGRRSGPSEAFRSTGRRARAWPRSRTRSPHSTTQRDRVGAWVGVRPESFRSAKLLATPPRHVCSLGESATVRTARPPADHARGRPPRPPRRARLPFAGHTAARPPRRAAGRPPPSPAAVRRPYRAARPRPRGKRPLTGRRSPTMPRRPPRRAGAGLPPHGGRSPAARAPRPPCRAALAEHCPHRPPFAGPATALARCAAPAPTEGARSALTPPPPHRSAPDDHR